MFSPTFFFGMINYVGITSLTFTNLLNCTFEDLMAAGSSRSIKYVLELAFSIIIVDEDWI
jgi:hypothetical protein